MYWIMNPNWLDSALLLLQSLTWCAGGWLLIHSLFPAAHDRGILSGISLGLILHLFLVNVLAVSGITPAGYWISALLVLGLGTIAFILMKPDLPRLTLGNLQPLLWLAGLTLIITLIGRGLGIFDDRKNLALISTMAAGNIPPRFYMNADFLFSYHYGFQLLGANLMHTGGFFPWSAFDLSKGFTAALAILLCWSWAERFTASRSGGLWAAILFTFATGSRWLLLFAPQSFLVKAGERITFWGTSQWTGANLLEALLSPWSLEGGPPFPIPFAFNSGIFPPFILSAQAGPRSLGTIVLFLALLLIPNLRKWPGAAVLGAVFAIWALAAEATFGLFVLGFVVCTVLLLFGAGRADRRQWQMLLAALVLGGILSLFQGGTFTEMAKNLLSGTGQAGGVSSAAAFAIQIPPAIVSAHLGTLKISDPYQLAIGLCEMGAALLMIPVVFPALRTWLREGQMAPAVFAVSSFAGIFIPLFLAYDVERDITRLSTYGLSGMVLLALPAILHRIRQMDRYKALALTGGWTMLLCLGGLVILGSLLTAMPSAVFSPELAPIDAAMTLELWDQLEPEALVLDSHEWRSVVVTGRLTRSSISSFTRLPAWEELTAHPDPEKIRSAGYSYIYMDDYWWQGLNESEKDAFSAPCVVTILEKTDNCANCVRRMLDIRTCSPDN